MSQSGAAVGVAVHEERGFLLVEQRGQMNRRCGLGLTALETGNRDN